MNADTASKQAEAMQHVESNSVAEQAQINAIRKRIEGKLDAARTTHKGITKKDLNLQKLQMTEEVLERRGALNFDQKFRALVAMEEQVGKMLARSKELEGKFYTDLQKAATKGWISHSSADRWKRRLNSEEMTWAEKQTFLKEKFYAKYYPNWQQVAKDLEEVYSLKKKLKVKAKDVPALADLERPDFIDEHYFKRQGKVDAALAALVVYERDWHGLNVLANEKLGAAVREGILSHDKVGTWLRRIFKSGASKEQIQSFLTGKKPHDLDRLMDNWRSVKAGFAEVEELRGEGMGAPGFTFADEGKFLNWNYSQRETYVRQALSRLKGSPDQNVLVGDIRRELDMSDWRSAQALIDQARKSGLSASDRAKVESMQLYLNAHKHESDQPEPPQELRQPDKELYEALAEVRHISPTMYSLYTKAIAKGYGTFSTLSTLMYNRCWVRNQKIWDDDAEVRVEQDAKESTEKRVRDGHTREYEANYIDGYGKAAIRDQDKGEWSAQPLVLGGDPGAQDALVAKCEANQNNHAFKYWGTLLPTGLGYESHKYLVENVNWKIKSAMRSTGAHMVDVASHERKKRVQSDSANYALAS